MTKEPTTLESVDAPKKAVYFEAAGASGRSKSANSLYNEYLAYFKRTHRNPNDKPMPFPQWIEGVKKKGLVNADGTFNADAAPTPTPDATSGTPGGTPNAETTTGSPNAEKPAGTATKPPAQAPVKKPADTGTGIIDKIKANPGKTVAAILVVAALFLIVKSAIKNKK